MANQSTPQQKFPKKKQSKRKSTPKSAVDDSGNLNNTSASVDFETNNDTSSIANVSSVFENKTPKNKKNKRKQSLSTTEDEIPSSKQQKLERQIEDDTAKITVLKEAFQTLSEGGSLSSTTIDSVYSCLDALQQLSAFTNEEKRTLGVYDHIGKLIRKEERMRQDFKVYVTCLPSTIRADKVAEHFSSAGEIKYIKMHLDERKLVKGASIMFADEESLKVRCRKMVIFSLIIAQNIYLCICFFTESNLFTRQ